MTEMNTLRPYHGIRGGVFAGNLGQDMEEYKRFVRSAYGTLRGVRFCVAKNRHEADCCLSEPEQKEKP